MKKIYGYLLLLFCLSIISCAKAPLPQATSPDKKILLEAGVENGKAYYTVKKNNKTILGKSFLGFTLKNMESLDKDFEIADVKNSSFSETWTQPWGEELNTNNTYNQLELKLERESGFNSESLLLYSGI